MSDTSEEISGNGVMYASGISAGGVLNHNGGGSRGRRAHSSTPTPQNLSYSNYSQSSQPIDHYGSSKRLSKLVEEEGSCDDGYETAPTLFSDMSMSSDDAEDYRNIITEDERDDEEKSNSNSSNGEVPILDFMGDQACSASAWFTSCFPCAVVDINENDYNVVGHLSRESAMNVMYSPEQEGKRGQFIKVPSERSSRRKQRLDDLRHSGNVVGVQEGVEIQEEDFFVGDHRQSHSRRNSHSHDRRNRPQVPVLEETQRPSALSLCSESEVSSMGSIGEYHLPMVEPHLPMIEPHLPLGSQCTETSSLSSTSCTSSKPQPQLIRTSSFRKKFSAKKFLGMGKGKKQ